jgi:tRNA pseudouridine55 synthase
MHGALLVDKPPGITSFQAVSCVRRALGGAKTGHSGTLDPMATGLLVVLAGEATKIAPYLDEEPKEYAAVMRLGVSTDTYDLDGEVLEEKAVEVDDDRIAAVLEEMQGRQMQCPPPYSAVKVRGKPLYKYAREGREVEAKSREIEVFSLEVEEIRRAPGLCEVECVIACSRGTYIRSICHEAGRRLGCGASLAKLRRTQAGAFSLQRALPLDEWCARLEGNDAGEVISIGDALGHLPQVPVEEGMLARVRNGHPLETGRIAGGLDPLTYTGVILVTDEGGLPLALHSMTGPGAQLTRVLRVLNLGLTPR